MGDIGFAAIVIALVISLYATVASVIAARSGQRDYWVSARNAVLVVAALTALASGILIYSFFARDFSLAYVAEYSSRDLAPIYTFSGWWAGQPGSLLLWATFGSLFGAIVVIQNRNQNQELMPWVVAVTMALMSFFLAMVAFTSNPFERLARVPADGLGLNPLLQNPGMFMHPPTLLLGYVGFTIPFAFAMAALITGRLGDQWIRSTRRWTLMAWGFLGLGNLLGAQWAYVELGWGGYMGWDPVENASFMPWLTATAFLHSVMIQQRRGVLKVWNILLIIITFALTLFGTTIVRSGILSSVHAFASGPSGPMFIGLIAVVLAGSLWLLWERTPQLKGERDMDALVSRESTFLFNNVLLIGASFAIFWGTIFPFITEAVRGVKIVVGPAFYNQVTAPIFLTLVVVMGICPLIGWRKATLQNLLRNFLYPLVISLAVPALLVVLGMRERLALIAFWALAFVGATILWEFARGVRSHLRRGDNVAVALPRLISSNKPRYGGYIVHLGVLLIAMGVAGSMGFMTSTEAQVVAGDKITIGKYDLTFRGLSQYSTATKSVTAATFDVSKNGKPVGRMVSQKELHKNQESPTTEVAIRSNLIEDLYVILASVSHDDGMANIKVLINPLVMWIWIGGGVMLAGGLIAFWPEPAEARRRVTQVVLRPVSGPELEAGNV